MRGWVKIQKSLPHDILTDRPLTGTSGGSTSLRARADPCRIKALAFSKALCLAGSLQPSCGRVQRSTENGPLRLCVEIGARGLVHCVQ